MRVPWALAVSVTVLVSGCGAEPTTLPVQEDQPGVEAPTTATVLPSDWPSDLPTTTGLPLVNATRLDSPQGPTWSATWQGPGDPGQIDDELAADLSSAGFTQDGGLGGEGDGGITTWTKGNMRLQLTVLAENGQVGVNITAVSQG